MARRVTAAKAQAELAECIRSAELGEPVIITRHGKPVAALVGADRLGLLGGANAAQDRGLAALAGGWKGSQDLVRTLAKHRRSRARGPVSLDA